MQETGQAAKKARWANEDALVAQAQNGDQSAFEEIFTQRQAQIYNFIYRMMGSPDDAYDMTQDTFLKAYLALPRTRPGELKLGPWLFRIATNVCLDELRHRQLIKWHPWEVFVSVFHPSQVAKDNPVQDCLAQETSEEAQAVLNQLHPMYRTCLLLREWHSLSYDEMAHILNTTRAAIKSRLFRARVEFGECWKRQPHQREAASC